MPTSGVTAYTNTARNYVEKAMLSANIVGDADDVTAAELAAGIDAINRIMKSWQGVDGVNLWLETNGTLAIPATEASGTLPENIRDVMSANAIVSATFERQLQQINREEYQSLPNKAAAGVPTCFYVSRQRDAVVVYVWPVPTVDTDLKIDYERYCDVVTDGAETVDVPEEYADTLLAVLAVRLCGEFGVQPSQELATRAAILERRLFDSSRPKSYFMVGV